MSDTSTESSCEPAAIGVDLLQRFAFAEGSRYRLAGIGLSNFVGEEEETATPESEPLLFGE